MIVHRVRFGPEWGRVERALDSQEHALPSQLHFSLRHDAEARAEEARSRVRRLPVRGSAGHTGLRERVAAGLTVTSGSMGFWRISTSMPSGQEVIPRGLDRRSGWSHPVFGHSWSVRQRPYRSGWFLDTFQDDQDNMANNLENQIEDAADMIAAAGAGP